MFVSALLSHLWLYFSGERWKAWWWCCFKQILPGHICRCWWGHQKGHEKIFCKFFFSLILILMFVECCLFWSALTDYDIKVAMIDPKKKDIKVAMHKFIRICYLVKFSQIILLPLVLHCNMRFFYYAGWVKWDSAFYELERSGFKEGWGKPSWWYGDEEMGILGEDTL